MANSDSEDYLQLWRKIALEEIDDLVIPENYTGKNVFIFKN
jgi:hypothetical protein